MRDDIDIDDEEIEGWVNNDESLSDWASKLKMNYMGLEVFKNDKRLLNEVTYDGCEVYFSGTDRKKELYYYTDRVTKSTFCLEGRPSGKSMRKKLEKMRTKFYKGGN